MTITVLTGMRKRKKTRQRRRKRCQLRLRGKGFQVPGIVKDVREDIATKVSEENTPKHLDAEVTISP